MIASEDIKSITDLKRNTKAIMEQVHKTKRPIILTVNGKADSVIIDIKEYEKMLNLDNLTQMLAEGENDIQNNDVQPASKFLKKFKKERGL